MDSVFVSYFAVLCLLQSLKLSTDCRMSECRCSERQLEFVANLEKALEARGGGGESLVLPWWLLWAMLLVICAQYNCTKFNRNVVSQHLTRFLCCA